ncbi:MAG: pro-sigmaK processing inhibitor BofA family protein [Clostridiales bacterium]|nr:pro-sigmaK processing inhibitor BofA family protein [Clostridiales bacterium]
MAYSFGATEYMICFLAAVFFCIVFSKFVKRVLIWCLRGALGLGAISVLNIFLEGSGLVLGVNLFNGVIIGVLGLPAFAGLYIIKLLTM